MRWLGQDSISHMTAIRAVFDGKTFVPQQAVSLPPQSEVLVLVDGTDEAAQQELDRAVRAYYQGGSDDEDEAWGRAIERGSQEAWEEH
jgi:hypothetical protein